MSLPLVSERGERVSENEKEELGNGEKFVVVNVRPEDAERKLGEVGTKNGFDKDIRALTKVAQG